MGPQADKIWPYIFSGRLGTPKLGKNQIYSICASMPSLD
jgi:hypothetical protein